MRNSNDLSSKIAMVTGANSGIGFEAAYQLAHEGYGKVILACRNQAKADGARQALIARGCPDVFEPLVVDVAEVSSAITASEAVLATGAKLDLIILNAGMVAGKNPQKNTHGVDMIFAASLVGHHAMTMNFLAKSGFADDAHVIVAGSEVAHGQVPGFGLPDLDQLTQAFDGDLTATLKAYAEATFPAKYSPTQAYAVAKLLVAWWAGALAERLPHGMTVNAVSPGAVTSTNFSNGMPWLMRTILFPVMGVVGQLFDATHSVSAGAKRYLDVAKFGADQTGQFYASRPGKMAGPLVLQDFALLKDASKRDAAYRAIVALAGGLDTQVPVNA